MTSGEDRLYPRPTDNEDSPDTWWERYLGSLSGLSETTRSVIDADCGYIVERGIFGVGEPGAGTWPDGRVRRGLVMGSVQSGKTASMLGVAAKSLDMGVNILVVLAGTRLSLWRQTFERLSQQLDGDAAASSNQQRRILVPSGGPISGENGSVPLDHLYGLQPAAVRRAVKQNRPIIVVAMKHSDHIRALGKSLRTAVFPAASISDSPLHMVVLDDEADDGSVIDAQIERAQDPIYGNLKQIPRVIADLWSPRQGAAPSNFYTTYIGYTATPQANFLQEELNPLAPRDFVISLRTPFDRGEIDARSSTFLEPLGLGKFYTGGEAYYERGQGASLCVETDTNLSPLADAIRAFLVAGAIRHIRDASRAGPKTAVGLTFDARQKAIDEVSRAHSMLVHPSAAIGDHLASAIAILRVAGVESDEDATRLLESGQAYLPATLAETLDDDEASWKQWIASYQASAEALKHEFTLPVAAQIPEWAAIKEVLRNEIIPGTRVSVINSDPASDDRPEYDPRFEDGVWRAPRDLSTIFVSGNVMARGLTLEGLTTTLFLRSSSSPFADSQMQMQRWFGYRGSYLELCRLFATRDQLGLFVSYHDVDEALRQVIINAMGGGSAAPLPSVLQGRGFLATGKIANLGNYPLYPGNRLVQLVNAGIQPDANTQIVSRVFTDASSRDVIVAGQLRGRMLEEPLTLLEAADLLDQFRFEGYAPGSENWLGQLWNEIQARVESIESLGAGENLYRPIAPDDGSSSDDVRKDCPYALGAYLRLWNACLTRAARGMFPTDGQPKSWSLVDLKARQRQQPKFWVGIRYGSGAKATEPPLADLPFDIAVTGRGRKNGRSQGWGSRNPSAGPAAYRGDEFLDYYFHDTRVTVVKVGQTELRPVGADGLILFYVNQPDGQAHPTVEVGTCVPLGGPDQFNASIVPSRTAAVGGQP